MTAFFLPFHLFFHKWRENHFLHPQSHEMKIFKSYDHHREVFPRKALCKDASGENRQLFRGILIYHETSLRFFEHR